MVIIKKQIHKIIVFFNLVFNDNQKDLITTKIFIIKIVNMENTFMLINDKETIESIDHMFMFVNLFKVYYIYTDDTHVPYDLVINFETDYFLLFYNF